MGALDIIPGPWDAWIGAGDFVAPVCGSATTTTRPNGFAYAVPIYLPGKGIDQIGVEITAGGTAGSVHRFGVWSINSTTRVPTLIAEGATTLDSTVTGFSPVAITVPARTGWVWCAAIQQGAPTTGATIRATNGFVVGVPAYGTGGSVTIAGAVLLGSGTTGAIPATYSALAANPNTNTNGPLIRARLV